MSTSSTIRSGDSASLASAALVPMLLGCAAGGNVGQAYVFDPGADVASVLKGGPLCDAVYTLLRTTGARVLATPAAPTWSPAPAVVHTDKNGGSSPTGPNITASLSAGSSGCWDDHTIVVTIRSDGPGGAAMATIAYDGATDVETVVIPAEPPAVLRGVVDLAALSYPYAGLDTHHLDFSAPAAKVLTFAGSFASPQAIVDAFNALAVAAPLAVRARLAQDTAGHAYFELYSTSGGAGVSVTIDAAASDADTLLGFTSVAGNLSATGAAALLPLPFTGLELTCPAGSYAKDEKYRISCAGPRASISALTAAASAAISQYRTNPFGFLGVVQPSDSAANCAALHSALATVTKSAIADANAPVYVTAVVSSPYHVASPVKATSDANILAADTALLAAFAAVSASLDSVAIDDVYLPGSSELRAGSFRRPASIAWAIKRAGAAKISADVADGLVPEASLMGPDGATRARDDNTASVKLGRGDGPGFSALHGTSAGLGAVKFRPGATRAGSASRLRYAGVVGVALEAARIIFAETEAWEGQTPETNPLTKMMHDAEKADRANHLTSVLLDTLRPRVGAPNVSAFSLRVLDPSTGTFVDNGKVGVELRFVPLGEIEDVAIIITATGTIIA